MGTCVWTTVKYTLQDEVRKDEKVESKTCTGSKTRLTQWKVVRIYLTGDRERLVEGISLDLFKLTREILTDETFSVRVYLVNV